MSLSCLIIDLDDTLADTSRLASYRDSRRWRDCASNLHLTGQFVGAAEALCELATSGVKIGIVTASPSNYANTVLKYHNIKYDVLIAYHDCSPRKPHPAPILMCIDRLGGSVEGSVGVGDAAKDAEAYSRAGIPAFGAGWSPHLDNDAKWTKILSTPADMIKLFD